MKNKKTHKRRARKIIKQSISIILSLILILSLFSINFTVSAAEVESSTETTEVEQTTQESTQQETVKSEVEKDTEKSSKKDEKIKETTEQTNPTEKRVVSNKTVRKKTSASVKNKLRTGNMSGSCGDNVTYSYDSDTHTLTISGTGEMWEFSEATYYENEYWVGDPEHEGEDEYGYYEIEQEEENPEFFPEYYSFASNIEHIVVENGVTRITPYSFIDCYALETLTISNTVTSLEFNFEYFDNLTTVNLGNGLSTIESYQFYHCSSLSNVTIGSGITSIGSAAFQECTSLSSITIPDNVTSIESFAFYNCTSLSTVNMPENITVGESAFENCIFSYDTPSIVQQGSYGSNITYTLYENGLFVIDGYGQMSNDIYNIPWHSWKYLIEKVMIKGTVTSICNRAFLGCDHLTEVSIANGVGSIGDNAFKNCTSLTTINIPRSITGIGSDAFFSCGSLERVNITDLASWCNINFSSSPTAYGALILNGSVITNLVIPEGVTTIKGGAFYGCRSIRSVTIPSSLTSIGSDAFGDTNIKRVNISDLSSYCSIDFGNNYSVPGGSLYLNNSKITNLVIPNGVTEIGQYAFYGKDSITSVKIPDTVSAIGYNAFESCDSIKKLYINSLGNWCNIDFESAFSNPLASASVSDDSYEGKLYINNNLVSQITIPNTVTHINSYAFYLGCENITNVSIPNTVTSIDEYAFAYLPNLSSIPNVSENCTVANNAFYNCGYDTGQCGDNVNYTYQNKTLTLSGTGRTYDFNSYGHYEYLYCERRPWENYKNYINTIVIEGGITIIGQAAFAGCTNVESIQIADTVTEIRCEAFYNCSSLETITLPNTIQNIGTRCFYKCTSLETIDIPESVERIRSYAFGICTALTQRPSINNSCVCEDYVFAGCSFSTDAYENIDFHYENDTLTISGTGAIPNFESTGSNHYNKCPWQLARDIIRKVVIEEGITDIRYLNAPYNVEEVVLPESCSVISGSVFAYCDDLETINLSNVDTIGDDAFNGCSSLRSVTIGNTSGNGSIGKRAFEDCINLSNVIISEGVETIDKRAFKDCSNLTSIIVGNNVSTIGKFAFLNCTNSNIVVPNTVRSIGQYAFYDCNMVICPMDSYTYELLTSDEFTKYRTSDTSVVGVATAKSQLARLQRNKTPVATSLRKVSKSITGSSIKKLSTGDGDDEEEDIDFEEEILTPEQIAENLSHVQCYVAENINIDEPLSFNSNLDITLHLNDYQTDNKGNVKVDSNGNILDGTAHTLSGSTNGALINVTGSLTIKTTGEGQGGIINNNGDIFDVRNDSSLIIENGNYSEDVSEYISDNKVIAKTGNLYTVYNSTTKDMEPENDNHTFILDDDIDSFAREELLGVQIRPETSKVSQAMRFVSVVRSDILRGAEDYGFILAKGRNVENMRTNKAEINDSSNGCLKVSAKGTSNSLANGEYCSNNLNEGKYKYITAAITDITDDSIAIGARLYIKRKDGTYVYADYTCISTMGELKALAA